MGLARKILMEEQDLVLLKVPLLQLDEKPVYKDIDNPHCIFEGRDLVVRYKPKKGRKGIIPGYQFMLRSSVTTYENKEKGTRREGLLLFSSWEDFEEKAMHPKDIHDLFCAWVYRNTTISKELLEIAKENYPMWFNVSIDWVKYAKKVGVNGFCTPEQLEANRELYWKKNTFKM